MPRTPTSSSSPNAARSARRARRRRKLSPHRVCRLDEIVPNTGVCALVAGEQVAGFSIEENIFAIGNSDPFSDANVLSRGIVGDLKGEPVVASPVYKQHFSLVSGLCLEDESVA